MTNETVERIIRDVAELPDRTSPDDWPEAMLVTADELRLILEKALSPAPTNGGASVPSPLSEQQPYRAAAEARVRELEAEVADLKTSVVAFAGPCAAIWAREHGLPKDHLHPEHYDLLARCGARMDDFTRALLQEQSK